MTQEITRRKDKTRQMDTQRSQRLPRNRNKHTKNKAGIGSSSVY